MPKAVSSPKYKITRGARGWQKSIHGITVWIASHKQAPGGRDADRIFEQRLGLPDDDPRKIRLDEPRVAVSRAVDLSVKQIADAFLTRKLALLETLRLDQGTYDDYAEAIQCFADHVGADTRFCELIAHHFGTFADALSRRLGVYRRMRFVVNVRSMFKWAGPPPKGVGLLPELPNYGSEFALPSRADVRRSRNARKIKFGPKRYTPAEVREQVNGKVIEIPRKRTINGKVVKDVQRRHRRPSVALKAKILLGLNAGFGNKDCAFLPISVVRPIVEGNAEWLDYARGKTGAERLAWLWPETRAALREWWEKRQKLKAHAGTVKLPGGVSLSFEELFFLTSQGRPWIHGKKDQIAMRHKALLTALGQPGRGFRSLRRTCRTILAETGQELAIDLIMGHADDPGDMAKVYTVELLRDVVKSVCQHGRNRLLLSSDPSPPPAAAAATTTPTAAGGGPEDAGQTATAA